MELTNPMTAVAALKLRQRMGSNHYLTFASNFALSSVKIKHLLQEDKIFGCGLTYGYDSLIGPIEASCYWSDRTDKVGFFINFGYNF
jgi:NTE family protein